MIKTERLFSSEGNQAATKGEHIRFQFYHYHSGPRPNLVSGCLSWSPPVDLYETATEVVLEVDLAGVKLEQIHVQLSDQILHLSGVRGETEGTGTRCYEIMEIERGSFERFVELPSTVDPEDIAYDYHDGVLVLKMRKQASEDQL